MERSCSDSSDDEFNYQSLLLDKIKSGDFLKLDAGIARVINYKETRAKGGRYSQTKAIYELSVSFMETGEIRKLQYTHRDKVDVARGCRIEQCYLFDLIEGGDILYENVQGETSTELVIPGQDKCPWVADMKACHQDGMSIFMDVLVVDDTNYLIGFMTEAE